MDRSTVLAGKILVVDDQENICWVLAKLLSERSHTVRTVQSAGSALSLIASFECHVAVVDYRLPDKDGCSLIQEMKLRLPRLRAILMTSYGNAALHELVSQGRAYAYFDKPFKNSAIIQVVEDAIFSWHQGTDSRARETTPRNGCPKGKEPVG